MSEERCGAKPPEHKRKYTGQSCVISKGHPGPHRSLDRTEWEAPDGSDSPASGGSRGAAVPVGDAQGRAPVNRVVVTICDHNANEERLRRAAARQELAKLGGELADGAEDILARIGEVGQTMTDAAARLEGEPRA